jgi:cytochrome c oxidase subunit 1
MRRVYTSVDYEFLNVWQGMNVNISHAAWLLGAAQIILLLNILISMWRGRKAEANPWQANTLEWSIPVPMPYYNYEKIPHVHRGPYEYSHRESKGDFAPQHDASGPTVSSAH